MCIRPFLVNNAAKKVHAEAPVSDFGENEPDAIAQKGKNRVAKLARRRKPVGLSIAAQKTAPRNKTSNTSGTQSDKYKASHHSESPKIVRYH